MIRSGNGAKGGGKGLVKLSHCTVGGGGEGNFSQKEKGIQERQKEDRREEIVVLLQKDLDTQHLKTKKRECGGLSEETFAKRGDYHKTRGGGGK